MKLFSKRVAINTAVSLIPSAITLGETVIAYNDIQDFRRFPSSDAKDEAKTNFSIQATFIGLSMFILSSAWLALYLAESKVWSKMSRNDRALVAGLAIMGVLAEIWPVARFGQENTTLWTGIVSSSSSLFIGAARSIAVAADDKENEGRITLISNSPA